MSFDDIIDRRNTHSAKWDGMQNLYGVSPDDGISMWVADMDFRVPRVALDAMQAAVDHGVFGYFTDERDYRGAICWWMENRHGWAVQPEWIFTTFGLVNGTAVCLETFTAPGDGVVLFTPVYHAFARVIHSAGRTVTECEMPRDAAGQYRLDIAAWDSQMTGRETMAILCSPHNPGGRVWTKAELEQIADFARRHDLILVSDEIHHDLVYAPHCHIPIATLDGIADRLVTMTSPSKTFNLAGLHVGNVIISDPDLRTRFAARMAGLGLSANSIGLLAATAVYSPAGASWVDDLITYLDGNRLVFEAGVNDIPGLCAAPLAATYLSWVDFSGTGMNTAEITRRVTKDARIAANYGATFGKGGEGFLRFNLATPRARVVDAVTRLQAAFGDLQ